MSGFPWITKWLEERNISQAAFAKAIGLDEPKTSRSINGNRQFKPKELALAAKFFNCSVEEVMTGKRIEKDEAPSEPQVMRDGDNAVADLIAGLYQILIRLDHVDKKVVHDFFSFLSSRYSRWHSQGDLKFLALVSDAVNGKTDEPPARMLSQILSRYPAGSA